MLKNFFKKSVKKSDSDSKKNSSSNDGAKALSSDDLADTLAGIQGEPDLSKMNMIQRLAWKQFQKMSPEKQREIMKKAMTPENIEKNKDEILKQLDAMKAAGMMSDDQYRLAKRRLGLK